MPYCLVVDVSKQEAATRRARTITIITVGGFLLFLVGLLTSTYTTLGYIYILCTKKVKVEVSLTWSCIEIPSNLRPSNQTYHYNSRGEGFIVA